MKITTGRIVHYHVAEEGEIKKYAALVTDVRYPEEGGAPQVLLTVFYKTGPQIINWIDKQGDEVEHWNWIPVEK